MFHRHLPWLFLAVLPACNVGDYELLGTVAHTMTPGQLTAIHAQMRIGSLELKEHAAATVDVTAEVRVRAELLPAAGKPVNLVFADWIALGEKAGVLSLGNAKNDDDHQLRVVLTVPAGKRDLLLRGTIGQITATVAAAASLRTELDTGQVRIAIDEVDGTADGKVGIGECSLQIRKRGPAGMDATVGTGSLKLALPADAAGTFDCSVDIGNIRSGGALGLAVERDVTAARATGKRGTGNGRFRLHVGTGEIDLR